MRKIPQNHFTLVYEIKTKNKMKLLINFSLIIILNLFSLTVPKESVAQSVSFQVFYDNLSPYGHWIDYPNYGYVWIPTAGPDFFPYSSNGHWVFTDYGWTWVSYYDWGWAPFHYGRWSYDDYYGWFWMPDNLWGPAWVVWRSSPGYYGWAPLGPNISINIVIGGRYNPPVDHWVFLPGQYMGRTDSYNYYGPRKSNRELVNNSTIISNTYVDRSTNTTFISGPRKDEVQKVTGTPVKSVEVRENSKPGQSIENNQLKIYRPAISKTDRETVRPAKISDKKEVKPITERNVIREKEAKEPIRKPMEKEPQQKRQEDQKSIQREKKQDQKIPIENKQREKPVQQREEQRITPQQKVIPKSIQKESPSKQAAPPRNVEKQAPVQKNIQPDRAPKPVPKMQEKPLQQRMSEPKSNVKPSQGKPRKEP